MLLAEGISKSFGNERVLNSTSISVGPRELVGLIGASGSGKSVLARCLVGLETWDEGRLTVEGHQIEGIHPVEDSKWINVRRVIGIVFQQRGLPPYRTAWDQIAEGPKHVLRLSPEAIRALADPWVSKFGLSAHLEKYPSELSGGQLARVCLARALVMQPRYLVCDELTAPLDPIIAAEVAISLLEIVNAGVGLLLISHQLEFLRRYATRVDFLDGGSIVASGSPDEMLVRPVHRQLLAFVSAAELGR